MAVKASATITLSFMVDVKGVYRYYKLQASTASAPAKPTSNPPSGWTNTEPSYTSGSTNTLYFVDLTVLTNNTWSYSAVSKSSSYEAAKEAYNKAQNAQNTANNAQNQLDNKGLRQTIIDLLDTETYDTDTYYPVVGTKIPLNGYHTFEVNNQLQSNCAPSWSTHTRKGFTCNLSVRMIANEWGTVSRNLGWIDNASYAWCNKMPAYIQQMEHSSLPVFYLRGGGKYYLYTDYACTWSIKTDTYTSSNESVAPTTTPTNYSKLVNNWDVVTRVANAETSITNNQNEIKLKATKTEVTEAINSIQVGGRNLLVNTNTDNLDWLIASRDGTIDHSSDISRSLGTRYDKFTIAKKSTSWAFVGIKDPDAIKEVIRVGGEFTLSFDVYCDAAVTISDIKIKNSNGTKTALDFGYFDTVAAEWTKIVLTGKVISGVDYDAQIVFINLESLAEESLIEFTNIKLEKGTRATDWTPAPEDVDASIETVYNKAVTAQDAADKLQSSLNIALDVITGTQTKTTGAWTGVAKFASLVDGQQIVYWLPYAGSGNATLNLTLSNGTTTGAKNCYYGGTSRLTTHYPAGSTIRLTYRENVSIAGSSTKYTGWWADANYNGDTYDRTKYNRAIKCGTTAIAAYNIIVGSGGLYTHLKSGAAFDITYPILYAGSSIAASATGTNNYLTIPFTVTTTQSITLTAYKPVYIKGKLSGTTFTPVSTTPLTQTVPTSADGYDYILLGSATSSTTEIYLMPEHPMFTFYDDSFKSFEQIAAEAVSIAKKYTDAQIKINSDSIVSTVSENYVSKDDANSTYAKSTDLKQTSDSFQMNFKSLQKIVSDNQATTEEQLSEWNDYIRFEGGNIILGKSGNSITCKITNDRLSFLQNGIEIAYLSNNQLNISKANVTNRLQIGNFVLQAKSDGGLTIAKST